MLCNLLRDWDGQEDQTTNFNQSDGATPEQNPHTPDGWCTSLDILRGEEVKYPGSLGRRGVLTFENLFVFLCFKVQEISPPNQPSRL